MSTLVATFPPLAHDWLKYEMDIKLYRRSGTIASGSGDLRTGMVLGQVTASKKWVPRDATAADGSQVAKAVLLNGCDATASDVETAIATGHAQIVPNSISWKAGTTDAQKASGLAELEAITIVSFQR